MRIHPGNFDFIRWRWHALALSLLIVAAGVVATISRGGLPLGVDFSGGTVIWLKFDQPVREDTVRNALGGLSGDATVQTFGRPGENEILIRLPLRAGVEEGTSLEEDARQVDAALRAANLGSFQILNREIVGPTIGADLQRKGLLATLFALLGIMTYIALRFRFSFGIGAAIASFHDVFVTLSILTLANYELSLNVIAAILTLVGYGVNDQIVVFDRVRENMRVSRREPMKDIINRAVNQTLPRTVITAGLTALSVLALYLFGGKVLEGFAFTMLVGIISSTYSTVYIASAVAILLSRGAPSQAPQGARAVEARRRRRA